MSEARNFDDYIKGKFNNFSPEVPSRIWEKIVAEKEKRKPKGFWVNFLTNRNILLLTGLLLAVGSGTLLLNYNQHGGVQTNAPLTKTGNNIPPTYRSGDKGPNDLTKNSASTQTSFINIADTKHKAIAKNNLYTDKAIPANTTDYTKNSTGVDDLGDETGKMDTQEGNNITHKPVITDIPASGSLMSRLLFGAQNIQERTQLTGELKTRSFTNVALPECPTFEKDAAGNKKYFELYVGPDYAIRSLTDTANSAYLQKRKESTSFSSAFSAGGRYTRVFKNCMSIRVGLNYSQINEKFTFVQGNVIQVTYVIDPISGDTTAAYTVRGSQHRTSYNHYKSVDIPLLLGYEFGYGRMHANINAGAIANVYSWQKGEVLDTSNHPVSITTGKGSSDYQYKTNLGMSLSGGISVYYKLNDVLHLLAEPYIRYNLSSMSKEDDYMTIRQKFTTIGMRLGVRLDIK